MLQSASLQGRSGGVVSAFTLNHLSAEAFFSRPYMQSPKGAFSVGGERNPSLGHGREITVYSVRSTGKNSIMLEQHEIEPSMNDETVRQAVMGV